jgi:hypothetical protein
MKTHFSVRPTVLLWNLSVALALLWSSPATARVLDNFDDNTVTDWQKFDFGSGIGRFTEAGGTFTIDTLIAPGQQMFVAATKTSKTFELKDGRTIEFRVDLVSANQPDAFAVLAWVPITGSVSSLQGYSLAKDVGDTLVAKGLGQYFIDDTTDVKNENVILVLRLTGKGTSVEITGRVLDKDANNAVIWEKTFLDTAGKDAVGPAPENPVTSYVGQSGHFVLIMYHNEKNNPASAVTFDNAEFSVTEQLVVDNFDDNTVTDWQKFDFGSGIGRLTEAGGTFTIDTLIAPGQQMFVAATKTSPAFELRDGDFVEFRADLVTANQPDAFAVLAWVPTTGSVSTLQGYSLAKDIGDTLIAKGLGQYFIDDTTDVKNDNVTLVLRLTGKGTSVEITGRVLDKDANNAVIWEKTFLDTAGKDAVGPAPENPVTSYIGQSGHFVLIMYHNEKNNPASAVTFDNAVATYVPSEGNTPPQITDVQPANGAPFQPASTEIRFTANDDKPIAPDKISVTLNGKVFTTANGLSVSGPDQSRTVRLGGLETNVNYVARLEVTDSDNVAASFSLYFDTFLETNFVIEVEDYNFNSGQFIDNPVVTADGSAVQADAYREQVGTEGIDFFDLGNSPRPDENLYRSSDRVDTDRAIPFDQRKQWIDLGGSAAGYFDYVVSEVEAGEWLNYTRTFPPGAYYVYLREAVLTSALSEALLELVTSDPTQPDQTTTVLGSFLGFKSGVEYRTIPLTDSTGTQQRVVRLSGQQTLRLRQNTPPDYVTQNYLIFVPAAGAIVQRAGIASASPAANSTVESLEPAINVVIENRDTRVNVDSIVLKFNGTVAPAVKTATATGATVSYPITPLPPPGSVNSVELSFTDNEGVSQTFSWSFTLTYLSLNPAHALPPGSGKDPGFSVRLVQSDSDPGDSISSGEDQLAGRFPTVLDVTATPLTLNYTEKELPLDSPHFPFESNWPGITPADQPNPNYLALEALAYLELPAGPIRFGVYSDDGFKLSSGASFTDPDAVLLGFKADGTYDGTFDVLVPKAGVYPLRLAWYEHTGNSYLQLFTVNRTTGEKTLVNDPAVPGSIKAYRNASPPTPTVTLLSATVVTGPYSPDPAASINTDTKTINIPRAGDVRFYRLSAGAVLRFKSIRLEAANVVMTYE